MSNNEFDVTQPTDVDPFFQEVALMKQLIQERTHPLELLRELISNAGAQEVGAKNIEVTYFIHPKYRHVFIVKDDGCGMNFTNDPKNPGRVDRFLGLGLSAIAGLPSDEFSWKGLGSKLAYQSGRIELETCDGRNVVSVTVNEPWKTIEDGKKPRPTVSHRPADPGQPTGTTVTVYGHPPYREEAFKFEEVEDYLRHRTFVGLTRDRQNLPKITLAVQTRSEEMKFGFPEMRLLATPVPEGTVVIDPPITVTRNVPGSNRNVQVTIKGFYTWDDADYGLDPVHLNSGLILAVKGIPYFTLDLRALGSGQLAVANPGVSKCCLIAECDSVQTEMNISRSNLVDSAVTQQFRKLMADAIQQIENSDRHRAFRQVPKQRKDRKSADQLKGRKVELEQLDQAWAYWQPDPSVAPVRLLRVPENETDTLAILWKLEALKGLPFAQFETLAYSGKGADLVVHFTEDDSSNPERYATMEVEYRFFNFKAHGHLIPQFPTVICWEVNPNAKLPVKTTSKPYKYVVQLEESMLRIYALSKLPGIVIATPEDLKRKQANQAWASNL